MRIKLTSVMVEDQDKALRFYTESLGFRNKHDLPVGEYRWITVVSQEGSDDLEVALVQCESRGKDISAGDVYAAIPLAAFEVADIAKEYARLKAPGVVFTREPATPKTFFPRTV